MILIHHHLGLGDHIVCNGLVNTLLEKYPDEEFTLAVKHHNVGTVKALYGNTIKLLSVENDSEVVQNYEGNKVVRVGFNYCDPSAWERSFYSQLGIPYENRWYKFRIQTTPSLDIMDHIQHNEYAIVATNTSIGDVDISVETEYPIVKLEPLTDSMLDWIYPISRAKEIHCVDSSFYHLVSQLPKNGERYYYTERKTSSPSEVNDGWILR